MLKSSLVLLLLVLPVGGVLAQAPADRERELLRRAQVVLREVTAERDLLLRDKARLVEQLTRDQALAQADRAQRDALRLQLERRSVEADARRAEIDLLKQQHAQRLDELQQAAAARQSELQQQLDAARAERDERTAANRSLAGLLASTTAALRDAERRIGEFHTLGRELIERWRHKTAAEALAHNEAVLGIGGVRAEDQAERWRTRVDALTRASVSP